MIQILLQLTNINKSFNGINVLSNVNLSVRSGRVMALVGENGAGKSTLMKVLTGIYEKDAGDILYLGKKAHFSGPKSSQEAGIGIIHQELNLIHSLSIAENIFLGREFINKLGCIDWEKTYLKADELLNELNLTYDSRRLVSDLSIGEQQMVEIAKVLSFDSKVIIMDEPTDSLTDKETASLFNVIKKLKKKNCGIVYISHRLKEIFEICDDVTILRDGLFVAEKKVKDIDENALIEMMVGRKLNEQYPRIEKKPGDVILEIKNFEGNGINNVSFELYESEILGISGLMGSGRTELMKMIYGLNSVDSGLIILNGKKLKINSPKDALSNNIVYISEDRKKDGLILDMSVKNNMSLSALHYFVNVFKKLLLNKERIEVNNFVNLFNVKTHSIEQTIEFLSGGNQQKVSIAKGLMLKPKILILDEPTRGVDVGAKKEIYDLINQLKQDGLSVILVSSEMSEVLGMSDRILVMHEGNITGHFLRETATQEKLMAAAVGKQA